MLEIWKLIEGHPNYMISNHGRIYSLKRKIYLKPALNNHGYYYVNLNKKSIKVHRLMAENFIPNPLNLEMVDHIDRDKKNNQLNNLRWVTPSMNGQNAGKYITNRSGVKNISFDKSKNSYQFKKIINGKNHTKRFKTIEEAVEYKERYLENNM